MTGDTNRGLEDLLRDRLHEVDTQDPPGPDFEFRALRAGRERLKRQQSWRRGLMGAAAAVVIGALAVPAVGRLHVTSGGSSASSGVAAQQEKSSAAAPQAGGGAAPGAADATKDAAGSGTPMPPSGSIGLVVPYAGTGTVEWDSPTGQSAIAAARSLLESRDAGSFTSLSVDRSRSPAPLVVHLTRFDESALRSVVGALPPDAPVAYALSAFSAQSCAGMLSRVSNDRSSLQQQGYAIGSTRCNDDGRVVVQVSNLVTAEQIRGLEVRYGDAVRVEQVTGTP